MFRGEFVLVKCEARTPSVGDTIDRSDSRMVLAGPELPRRDREGGTETNEPRSASAQKPRPSLDDQLVRIRWAALRHPVVQKGFCRSKFVLCWSVRRQFAEQSSSCVKVGSSRAGASRVDEARGQRGADWQSTICVHWERKIGPPRAKAAAAEDYEEATSWTTTLCVGLSSRRHESGGEGGSRWCSMSAQERV